MQPKDKADQVSEEFGYIPKAFATSVADRSDNLDNVEYDHGAKLLAITFKNGALYHYRGVPPGTVEQLLQSDSLGSFLHKQIIPRYESMKITGPKKRAKL